MEKRKPGRPFIVDKIESVRRWIRVDTETHKKIVERAKKNMRSFAREVEFILKCYLNNGISE